MIKIGSFYHAYGKDAYILSYLLGYQIKTIDPTTTTCGFPVSALNKVATKLDEKKVNYIEVSKSENYEVQEDVTFKSENQYNVISDKAYRYIMKRNKIESIYAYLLDNINDDRLQANILKIEQVLYGSDL